MDVPTPAEVVEQIDSFLERHSMKPSRFGRDALGEPQFVAEVRSGRAPGLTTLVKLRDFMRERDAVLERSAIAADRSASDARPHRLNAGAR